MHRLLIILCTLVVSLAAAPVRAQVPVPPQQVDFTLPDLDGRSVRLSGYRGRWVIVNFWATWCTPCLREIPELNWFAKQYRDRATVIGINYETTKIRSVKNFVAKMEINSPIVRIGEEPLIPFEPLKGLPTTFFVSPEGEYVAKHVGSLTAEDIERFLKSRE